MSTENQTAEPASQQAESLPLPTRIELSEGKSSLTLPPVGSHNTDPFAAQTQPLAFAPFQAAAKPEQAAPASSSVAGQTNSTETQPAKG